MNVTGRNKKCLFLNYFRIVVRKKDMVIKPVKNVFFNKQKMCFIGSVFVISHTAYRWAALYLASKWMHIPINIAQNEK